MSVNKPQPECRKIMQLIDAHDSLAKTVKHLSQRIAALEPPVPVKPDMVLTIETTGDPSVGIQPGRFSITFHGLQEGFLDEEYRRVAKEVFAHAVNELDDFPIRSCFWSDECPDCGKQEKDCHCSEEAQL